MAKHCSWPDWIRFGYISFSFSVSAVISLIFTLRQPRFNDDDDDARFNRASLRLSVSPTPEPASKGSGVERLILTPLTADETHLLARLPFHPPGPPAAPSVKLDILPRFLRTLGAYCAL